MDFVSPEDDFRGYRLLIAPVWYMVKGDADEKIDESFYRKLHDRKLLV